MTNEQWGSESKMMDSVAGWSFIQKTKSPNRFCQEIRIVFSKHAEVFRCHENLKVA